MTVGGVTKGLGQQPVEGKRCLDGDLYLFVRGRALDFDLTLPITTHPSEARRPVG